MPVTKRFYVFVSLIILIINVSAVADWKENAKAIKISGGEDHTLALTKNKFLWGCGESSGFSIQYFLALQSVLMYNKC